MGEGILGAEVARFETAEKMLDSGLIDACIVSVPHYDHPKYAIADGSEGINGMTLSNAMHLSSWLDKKVTLPLDEELYYEELMKRVATSRRKTGGKAVFAATEGTYGS